MAEIHEDELEKVAMEKLKLRHHHTDGSEVVLSRVEESGMERRIIEEEQEWKLKAQQTATAPADSDRSRKKKRQERIESAGIIEVRKEEKKVVAGCSCGRVFSGTFSDSSNPAGSVIRVKAYDASGNVSGTYSEPGAPQADYKVSGDAGKDYAPQ